jgi:hypothetical protein
MVRLGHAADMQVMGYFCIGSNTRWGLENPDLSYGATSQPHIPFTDTYLAYLSETIRDALKRTGMDGFMIDWIWNPIRVERPTRWWEYDMEWVHDTRDWIDAEKALYEQLMGERFPDSGLLSTAKEIEYGRRALARCWKVIREARDAVNPDAVIWLSCNNVDHPHLEGSALFHEVDWFMNEHPDAHVLESLEARIGPNSGIMQCLCGWGDKHDASTLMPHLAAKGIGLYGFARPDASSFPPIHSEDPALAGNAANIETIAHFYRQQN